MFADRKEIIKANGQNNRNRSWNDKQLCGILSIETVAGFPHGLWSVTQRFLYTIRRFSPRKDLDTVKEQSITITDKERMSDEEIQRAFRDTEQYMSQDDVRRQAIDITYEASKCLTRAETALGKVKKNWPRKERRRLKPMLPNCVNWSQK